MRVYVLHGSNQQVARVHGVVVAVVEHLPETIHISCQQRREGGESKSTWTFFFHKAVLASVLVLLVTCGEGQTAVHALHGKTLVFHGTKSMTCAGNGDHG